MLDKIALRRLLAYVNHSGQKDLFQAKVLEFELGQLGVKVKNIDKFTSTTREQFETVLSVLKEMRGGDVKYVPLFARFPDDLPNDGEYLIRRVLGFFGLNTFIDSSQFGADPITQMQQNDLWLAAVKAQAARLNDTHTEWIILTIVSQDEAFQQLEKWALDLLYGATSVNEALWDDIFTILSQLNVGVDMGKIRVKETVARLAAHQWQQWSKITVKTPTDLLRMFAFIQGQDVSLAKPVDLKGLKLSKPQRREVLSFLNRCPALAEDLLRYKGLWVSLSKWLHPGDFVLQFPTVVKAFDDLRNGRIKSYESLVINSPAERRIDHLLERPSVMLRKLTWLLKEYQSKVLADTLYDLSDKVTTLPLSLLVTAYFAIKYNGDRFAINKKGKPHTIKKRESLGDISPVLEALDTLILTQLRGSKKWDKVWIDPAINKLVLPLQARKQSDGLLNLARGSRISLADGGVVRLFVYWHQSTYITDLDLSVMKLDQDFKFAGHIGWNNYGTDKDIAHSGDIQSAPLGAAEFIDLRLAALTSGYILPSIIRYAGEGFSDMKACYAGWMNRENVGSDTQTFEPKTVAQKVNVNLDGRAWIPFLLDVTTREVVYVDLYFAGRNTIESNEHFPSLSAALASYWQAKPTFGALAHWYVRANYATLVDRKNALTTIGITDDCSINVLKLVGEGVTSF
ncbi:MAG: hypothetical protein PUP91_22360 [Rhizonema sp. PD37]|nr:hypothetical protein [Rhizonema sp. PD37]